MDSSAFVSIFGVLISVFTLFVLLKFIRQIKEAKDSKPSPSIPVGPHGGARSHRIGGCAGTRYGCCPNGRTPRANPRGTNC